MSERTDRLFCLLRGADTRIVITGHDAPDVDSLLSCVLMQRFLSRVGIDAQIVLATPPDASACRAAAKLNLDIVRMQGDIRQADSLILLDHHHRQHDGQVIACIDHHPTDFPPSYPYTQIEPCGACAYQVLRLMREAGITITAEDESLAVCALYLDTIALRSSKILPQEAAWARETAVRLGLDAKWLEQEGLELTDLTKPAETLAMEDFKEYTFDGKRVYSTCIQTDEITDALLQSILAHLHVQLKEKNGCLWVYLIHNPCDGSTMQYDVQSQGGVRAMRYDYLASRSKDIIPRVEKRLREEKADDGSV